MTKLPKEPSGSHALEVTVRDLIRYVRERTIVPTPGVKVNVASNGTSLAIDASKAGGSTMEIEICKDGESGWYQKILVLGAPYRKDEE